MVVGLPILFGYTVAGINDTLLVPFLLVVAYRWSDIGRTGRLGRGGITRAVCLGLAASISPVAWFIAPFVVLGIFLLRAPLLGGRGALAVAARFTALVGMTFGVINGPFMFWSPTAWLAGVGTPLFQHAIPYGQGLIDATVFFHLGGGNLAYYTYASVAIFAALLVVFVAYFRRMWLAAFILPSAALFFPTRSLAEYFMTLISVWVVSLVSPGSGPSPEAEVGRRRLVGPESGPNSPQSFSGQHVRRPSARLLALAAFLPGLAFLVLALSAAPPLVLTIRSVETNGQLQKIWQMQVEVTNRSRTALAPHFATNFIGQMTSFWNANGPKTLQPGQSATYRLVAPNIGSMPGITQPLILQVVTAGPESISSTPLYTPEQLDSYISPGYVDHPVPLGRSVSLQVQLRSPYGDQIRQPGVRIALSQLIYAQSALIPAEAQINDAPEGQTPVTAETNADGIAVFRLQDSSVQGGNPVYFQAYVDPHTGFPYGYSEIVSVLWSPQASAARARTWRSLPFSLSPRNQILRRP